MAMRDDSVSPEAGGLEAVLERSQWEPHFGPLRSARDWHRLKERVSKSNRNGRRLGVRLSLRRDRGEILVSAARLEGIGEFQRRLAVSPGHVQRSLADLLRKTILDPRDREARSEAPGPRLAPLHIFSGFSALMEKVFIAPPYRFEPPRPGRRSATALAEIADTLLAAGAGHMMISGPPGIGKSTLLDTAFRERLEHSKKQGEPVFLPAPLIRASPGRTDIPWTKLRGGPAGERRERLFYEGRLALYIDGIDENPSLDEPGAWGFWEAALKNRCIITCRDGYFLRHFLNSPLHRALGPTPALMRLLEWGPAQAGELYRRLSETGARGPGAALAPLARLSSDGLRKKMGSIRLGGLTAWAYAAFFASRGAGRFPDSEYEILEHIFRITMDWERVQPGAMAGDVAAGLLTRAAWMAYSRELAGERLRATSEDISEIIRRDYPFLLKNSDAIFTALGRLPFMKFDGIAGAFDLDRVFAHMLAARHLIGLAERGEAEGLRRALQTPLNYEATSFLYQALAGLDGPARAQFLRTGRRAFESARRALSQESRPEHRTSMQGLLQPIGRLGLEESADFLRELFAGAGRLPEPVQLSLGRALAYAGDTQAVAAYIERLRKNRRAREVNRNFYLYWLRDGRAAAGGDWTAGLRFEGWPRTCAWFLRELVSREFQALRPIHLFTFCDLAETFGMEPAAPEMLRSLAESLEREAGAQAPLLQRELKRLRRLAGLGTGRRGYFNWRATRSG